MSIKAILFDKDGTLFDFEGTYGPAAAKVIQHLSDGDHGLACELARIVEFDLETETFGERSQIIAGHSAELTQLWLGHLSHMPAEELNQEIDRLFTLFSLTTVVPFEGMEETLAALQSAGHVMGIATNDSEAGAYSQLEIAGIADFFGFVAGYDSGHGAKPLPGMVTAFASHAGLNPSEIAMVGDSLHDMHCARSGGATAIAVTTGLAGADELAPHSDHVIDGIGGLPNLIAILNGKTARRIPNM